MKSGGLFLIVAPGELRKVDGACAPSSGVWGWSGGREREKERCGVVRRKEEERSGNENFKFFLSSFSFSFLFSLSLFLTHAHTSTYIHTHAHTNTSIHSQSCPCACSPPASLSRRPSFLQVCAGVPQQRALHCAGLYPGAQPAAARRRRARATVHRSRYEAGMSEGMAQGRAQRCHWLSLARGFAFVKQSIRRKRAGEIGQASTGCGNSRPLRELQTARAPPLGVSRCKAADARDSYSLGIAADTSPHSPASAASL